MGRKKVSMIPIIDHKKRNMAFKQRKPSLIKKASELAILCDADVSMIIFSDQQEKNPEIFPPGDTHKLNNSINAYKSKRVSEPRKIRTYGLRDFFMERKRKAEEELARAKKRNLEAKYPTRVSDSASEGELRNFAYDLYTKIEQAKRRIDVLGKVPKIENLYAQDSSCRQLWNPMTMMRPAVGYSDQTFDHAGYNELSNPELMMDLLLKSEENEYFPMQLYGDNQNILSMVSRQSSNPNSIITSEGGSSCYDCENSGLPPLPLAMVQPQEVPLTHMNSFLASSFPSHVLEYERSGSQYLAS